MERRMDRERTGGWRDERIKEIDGPKGGQMCNGWKKGGTEG